MTGNIYQKLAARTINENLTDDSKLYHALFGMVSEIGEIHSLYQKFYQGHGRPSDEHVKKELGDLLWFICELCTVKHWSLEDIMMLNIEKLTRRYPDGFDVERSKHRAAGDI